MVQTMTAAAVDRYAEWRAAYLMALGLQDDFPGYPLPHGGGSARTIKNAPVTTASKPSHPARPVILNLLPNLFGEDDNEEGDEKKDNDLHDESEAKVKASIKRAVHSDPWMDAALEIQENLNYMTNWLNEKQYAYVSVEMSDQEASLIQSTVTSYTATTANELESLRSMIQQQQQQQQQSSTSSSSDWQQHQASIIQILLARLKEQVAAPFEKLQKQRKRQAVTLWQHPLTCRLYTPKTTGNFSRKKKGSDLDNALGGLLGDDDDNDDGAGKPREQRFFPTRPTHLLQRNFLESYHKHDALGKTQNLPKKRPKSILGTKHAAKTESSFRPIFSLHQSAVAPDSPAAAGAAAAKGGAAFKSGTAKSGMSPIVRIGVEVEKELKQKEMEEQLKKNRQQQRPIIPNSQVFFHSDAGGDEMDQQAAAIALQQEAALLTALHNNDLDAVQKMEQRMVDITTLLGQFSELVAEQQEDVWEIAEATNTAKDNMDKGQENLVDATTRTAESSHYMAKAIFGMGVILLFFHSVRP